MKNQWPDGGSSPFRSGRTRTGKAPSACPASIAGRAYQAGHESSTELFSAEDWLPTLVAAAGGDPGLSESSLKV